MNDVGLSCEETTPAHLQESIEEVRSTLRPSNLQAFMIAGDIEDFHARAAALGTDVRQVMAAGLTSGAQELTDGLADADPKVQNLMWILGTAKAGTRGFVQELVANDRAGQELFNTINAPGKSARSFVEQLKANSGLGGRITDWVAGYGSPAVSFLARMADMGQEPVATGNWTPSPTGGITGPYATMLGSIQEKENFNRLPERYEAAGELFLGRAQSVPGQKRQLRTSDAIVGFFKESCQMVVSMVARDVDAADLEALISTYIQPVDTGEVDYNLNDFRRIYLAEDYDAENQMAMGVGIVALHYDLTVKGYKDKSDRKDDQHDVTMDMDSRAMQYSGVRGFSDMCLDNKYVTAKCDAVCREVKEWYEDNPQYGTWPETNKECPAGG
ncbi:hypothetical protein [Streptomyces sp. NPDC052042]|uniref:hypothetical protein n=1 Tax=Streptomyces sp. NPDC052042 TaxID=3365683 RepID=UPI0037D23C0E